MHDLDPDYRSLPAPVLRGPRMAIIAMSAMAVIIPLLFYYLNGGIYYQRGIDERLLLGFMMGSLAVQPMLAAFWSAFGPGEGMNRRLRAAGWLMLPATAMGFLSPGYRFPNPFEIFCLSIGMFVFVLTISGILQLLLWPIALFGWRLGVPAEEDRSGPWQWSVRHLLYLLTGIGVLMGIGRLILPEGIPQGLFFFGEHVGGGLAVSLLCLFAVLKSPGFRVVTFMVVALILGIELAIDVVVLNLSEYDMPAAWPHFWIACWSILMAVLWRYAGLRLVRRDFEQPIRR